VTLTVTVGIPSIPGREEMLARALESVAVQTRQVDQVIVDVDVDRTGAAHTRNRILDHCDTDLIAWLDDDDLLLPRHVERLARVLERVPDFDLVYPIPHIPEGRDPTATSVNGIWQLPWRVPFGAEQETHLREQGSFIPITHMVRTEKVREAGGFPIPGTPEWPRENVEDWGYLIRLLDAGAHFFHLPVKTWQWTIHTDASLHTGGQPNR
jgi:glycosyltransferase involved in cell wall biosynthesis